MECRKEEDDEKGVVDPWELDLEMSLARLESTPVPLSADCPGIFHGTKTIIWGARSRWLSDASWQGTPMVHVRVWIGLAKST